MLRIKMFIVKAEPWQIFATFIVAMLFYRIVPDEYQLLQTAALILLNIVILGWLYVLGKCLNENLPDDKQRSDTLFVISFGYVVLVTVLVSVLKYITDDLSMDVFFMVSIILYCLSFLYILCFVSILFVDNQEEFLRNDKLNVEFVFILFLAFILGVLVLQTRIKRFFIESAISARKEGKG